MAVGAFGVGDELSRFSVGADLIRFARGDVGEEDLALGVHGGALGETVTLADELPALAGDQERAEALEGRAAGLDGLRPIVPEPADRIGEQLRAVFAVVAAVAPDVAMVVTGVGQGALHGLVGHPPIAAVDIVIVGAVLEENAESLGLGLADEARIAVAAAETDVGADDAEDAGEFRRTFPRRGEGGDGTAAGATDGAVVAGFRKADRAAVGGGLGFDGREDFLEEETRVGVAEAVELVAAIKAVEGGGGRGGFDDAGADEHADEDGDFAAGDQVVEDGGGAPLHAVLVDVDAGGLGGGVLARDVDCDLASGAGKNLGGCELEFDQFALGHAGLDFGIGAGRIVVSGAEQEGGETGGEEENGGGGGERGA